MRFSELIEINNRFEKSINLSLDMNDLSKINYYIPTHSSVKVLEKYLDRIIDNNSDRSTVLIGPYGKGKSHLILILLNILKGKDAPEIEALIKRIGAVDKAVENKIRKIIGASKPFLPIIVNVGRGSLAQSFIKSLHNALKLAGVEDVLPDNYFTEAVKTISVWKNSYPDTFNALFRETGDTEKLIEELTLYDENALKKFMEVYPKLTSGSMFNPVIDDDIKTVFSSVNRKLSNEHGYSGIYIVFDEFSKYIEGHSIEGFSSDMMTLQDICELCSKSKDEQAHLTIITHKAVKEYGSKLPIEISNTYKAIEGRLQEEYFIVSSQNNYELISDALKKTEYFSTWKKKDSLYKKVSDETYSLSYFRSLFSASDYEKIVAEGSFPLTPVGAMLLLNLSEKIAQNERTIFTYLTDKTANGLARLISGDEEAKLLGAGNIYDYFIPTFREDGQTNIHHEWLKADFALTKAEDKNEIEIIKTLAIIKMINNPDSIPANETFVRLGSALSSDEFEIGIEALKNKGLIDFKSRLHTFEFKNNIGIDVESAIADCIQKFYLKADISQTLDDVIEKKAILPKKHNMTNRMTRYFNCHFVTREQFLNIKSFDYIKENNLPDGDVLLLLADEGLNELLVTTHLAEINDSRLVVVLPSNDKDCVAKVQMLLAVRRLRSDASFIEGNAVLRKELDNIEEDIILQINEWINTEYFNTNVIYHMDSTINVGSRGINRGVSDICDETYNLTAVINHELINRHVPTAQIIKARNVIIDDLLNGRIDAEKSIDYEKGTAPEATIYRAVILNTKDDSGVLRAKEIIDDFILNSVGSKKNWGNLMPQLTNQPIGMRKGVIAIYVTEALMKLGDIPVIYLGNKEVPLNVETINNILKKPEDYWLYVEQETVEKNNYLNRLTGMFEGYSTNCLDIDKRNRLAKVLCMIQSWFRSLPQTSRIFQNADELKVNIKEINLFRKLFGDLYLNPREVLFERIPAILKAGSLEESGKKIELIKYVLDEHIHFIKAKTIDLVQEKLGLDKNSDLYQGVQLWYSNISDKSKNKIYATRTDDLFKTIKKIDSSDKEVIIGKIAKAVSGSFIEDWNDEGLERFNSNFDEILAEIDEASTDDSETTESIHVSDKNGEQKEVFYDFDESKISTNGSFFKNALLDTIEEYGDSLDANEKIGILMNMVKNLLKQE